MRTTASSDRLGSHGPEFFRMPSVLHMTGLGRSTIYRLMARRKFPPAVKLGDRAVGWRRTDIADWMSSRESNVL